MSTTNTNNPDPKSGPKYPHDTDNVKQHQDRQVEERKHSLQSGNNAGRNNISPGRSGKRGGRDG